MAVYSGKKRGLTLIELLVVVMILLILVTVVLPLVQPNSNERLVREAARQVNAFFANVQSRAQAENRPYGVILVREAGSNGPCFDLAVSRVPRPYTGDDVGAVAEFEGGDPWTRKLTDADRIVSSEMRGDGPYVENGDLIRFNHRGHWFKIVSVDPVSSTEANVEFERPPNSNASAPPTNGSLSYQIRRTPRIGNVRRSASSTMTLPVGAFVDMSVSGMGAAATMPAGPVIIMVDGQGRLSSVNGLPIDIADSLYLLIGAAQLDTGSSNKVVWQNEVRNLSSDAGSVWLTVGRATGRLQTVQSLGANFVVNDTTAEVRVTSPSGSYDDYNLNDKNIVNETGEWYDAKDAVVSLARATANTGPAMGGR